MSTAEEPSTLIRAADNGLYIELVFLSNYHSASSYEDSTVRTVLSTELIHPVCE